LKRTYFIFTLKVLKQEVDQLQGEIKQLDKELDELSKK
jgi:cell division protein FtsB